MNILAVSIDFGLIAGSHHISVATDQQGRLDYTTLYNFELSKRQSLAPVANAQTTLAAIEDAGWRVIIIADTRLERMRFGVHSWLQMNGLDYITTVQRSAGYLASRLGCHSASQSPPEQSRPR
jgi:hypothetical protein